MLRSPNTELVCTLCSARWHFFSRGAWQAEYPTNWNLSTSLQPEVGTWGVHGVQNVPRSAWVKTDAASVCVSTVVAFAVLLAASVFTHALRGTFCTFCTPSRCPPLTWTLSKRTFGYWTAMVVDVAKRLRAHTILRAQRLSMKTALQCIGAKVQSWKSRIANFIVAMRGGGKEGERSFVSQSDNKTATESIDRESSECHAAQQAVRASRGDWRNCGVNYLGGWATRRESCRRRQRFHE